MSMDRRTFVKSSLTGAAGLSLASPSLPKIFAAAKDSLAWTDKMPINPAISNMKVVCFNDPDMCTMPTSGKIDAVNKCVKGDIVDKNMDKMAMELAGKTSAEEAWKTIFRSSKEWKDTKVMIKVNSVNAKNLPRVAIIKKITDVLAGFGVLPANMILFDGHGDASGEADPNRKVVKYVPFASLTDITKIRANVSKQFSGLGGTAAISFPDVSNGVAPKELVSGNIDIIVNIAVNRGHDQEFNGRTTLCLKNHYGTFVRALDPTGYIADIFHSYKCLIDMNKHELLVGGTPVRQQLCIIDSILAAKDGPFENGASDKPDRIIMGTFAGAVDYCCVKKIRQDIMKMTTHDNTIIAKYLTDFGYAETDPQWVELSPTATTIEKVNPPVASGSVSFTMTHSVFRRSTIRFSIPAGNNNPLRTRIFDMHGSLVAEIQSPAGLAAINWDGKTPGGRLIGAGNYIVDVCTEGFRTSEKLTVIP